MSKNFEFAVKSDEELKLGEHKWYGKEDQTEDQSIHDKGQGEAVVIRVFEFKFKPGLLATPTAEQLLTPEYLKSIDTQLWGDALRRVMHPRINITKEGCQVFVPCVATTGNSHLENPKLLQEWLT